MRTLRADIMNPITIGNARMPFGNLSPLVDTWKTINIEPTNKSYKAIALVGWYIIRGKTVIMPCLEFSSDGKNANVLLVNVGSTAIANVELVLQFAYVKTSLYG